MMRYDSRAITMLVALALSLGASLAEARTDREPEAPSSAARWQAMARKDLDAAHASILADHPGVIDAENPSFNRWVEEGFRAALRRIPRVVSYDTALSAVRFYISGFRDNHLIYSDDVRSGYPIYVSGWHVRASADGVFVDAVLPHWSLPLPPVGARLIDCDGRDPNRLFEEEVAPYVDRRPLAALRNRYLPDLWKLQPSDAPLRTCTFERPDGRSQRFPVRYGVITEDTYFRMVSHVQNGGLRAPNNFELNDGVLWIRAGNFNLRPDSTDAADLTAMLGELRAVDGAKLIVFDTRGNRGGNSDVGDRIFEAATGGLVTDTPAPGQLPLIYAQWRVSDFLIASLGENVAAAVRLFGAKDPNPQEVAALLTKARAAQVAGKPWIEQDAGPRLRRADVLALHGRLRRFSGRIALVTDSRCGSACLDFCDEVLAVPEAVHLGETTDADALYIDSGRIPLPSGNSLVMPRKVWRNRIRGNNQPYVPAIPLTVDMADDMVVRKAVLAAMGW